MLFFLGLLLAILSLAVFLAFTAGLVGFFKVKEGTSTSFELTGRYCCTIMSLENFHFENGLIVSGPGPSQTGDCRCLLRIGGWVFYLTTFVDPVKYLNQNNDDGFGKDRSVFLNQIQREVFLPKAETKQDDIPVNLRMAFKMVVVRPYEFLYRSPKDVIVQTVKIMEGVGRGWVRASTYEEIQAVKTNGGGIGNKLGQDSRDAIATIKRDWGVEIPLNSILLMDVGLLNEDQDAFAAKKRQRLLTSATAQQIMGVMLENEALSLGLNDGAAARSKLEETTEGKAKLATLLERAQLAASQKFLGVKPNLFGNADGTKLDPITATAAALISLARGGNQGPQETTDSKKTNDGGIPKTQEKSDEAKLDQEIKDLFDGGPSPNNP